MKINEKNLYTFANSKPVDKEGELALTFRAGSDFKMCPSEKKCFIRIHFLTFDFNFFFLHVQGFLQFKREMKFQKRWFVLKGNLLFYFDKRGDKEPVGLLLLEGCKRVSF
jgi:PH domain